MSNLFENPCTQIIIPIEKLNNTEVTSQFDHITKKSTLELDVSSTV